MAKYISQSDLSKLYYEQKHTKETVDEIKSQYKTAENTNKRHSIFLCHSHLDKTIVNKILVFFNNLNIDIYIDWMDVNMPELTNKTTATIIKEKIDNSHKFLFLATYNALRSKWCNWELGVAYSSKGENDFAILPIESKSGKWFGNEYLQLYPEMQIESFDDLANAKIDKITIDFYGKRSLRFNDWLSK